jgi:hypothetical protein
MRQQSLRSFRSRSGGRSDASPRGRRRPGAGAGTVVALTGSGGCLGAATKAADESTARWLADLGTDAGVWLLAAALVGRLAAAPPTAGSPLNGVLPRRLRRLLRLGALHARLSTHALPVPVAPASGDGSPGHVRCHLVGITPPGGGRWDGHGSGGRQRLRRRGSATSRALDLRRPSGGVPDPSCAGCADTGDRRTDRWGAASARPDTRVGARAHPAHGVDDCTGG